MGIEHIGRSAEGVTVTVRRSNTDEEGRGATKVMTFGRDAETSEGQVRLDDVGAAPRLHVLFRHHPSEGVAALEPAVAHQLELAGHVEGAPWRGWLAPGRLVGAREDAEFAAYLCSEAANCFVGQIFPMCGGWVPR